MIIPRGSGRRTGPPSISIRADIRCQRPVALSSALCAQFPRRANYYVALGVDEKKAKTYLILCGPLYKNQPAYKLIADGSGNKSGKVFFLTGVARSCFTKVRVGKYPAKFVRGQVVINTPGVTEPR